MNTTSLPQTILYQNKRSSNTPNSQPRLGRFSLPLCFLLVLFDFLGFQGSGWHHCMVNQMTTSGLDYFLSKVLLSGGVRELCFPDSHHCSALRFSGGVHLANDHIPSFKISKSMLILRNQLFCPPFSQKLSPLRSWK